MESLQPHEKLDDLIRFGSISKVKQAMRRGKEVFIFLSHQWLAFDQPDPDNVHFTAMKQAVTAVAADAGVPIEQTRVWVDYCSIPQENQSEQRLAIASLPTFSSSSSFWANPPRAQQGDGRPALSRATTWRTSAPRLAHEDSKEDLDV